MDGTPHHPQPVDGLQDLLDRVVHEDSVEAALARGTQALAGLAAADVAALFLIDGSECVLQTWHPADPAVRERHQVRFRVAAAAACGRGPGPGALTSSAAGPRPCGASTSVGSGRWTNR